MVVPFPSLCFLSLLSTLGGAPRDLFLPRPYAPCRSRCHASTHTEPDHTTTQRTGPKDGNGYLKLEYPMGFT
jgi:hypothetical protein